MNRRSLLKAAAATAAAPLLIPSGAAQAKRIAYQSGAEWFTNVPLQNHEGRTVRFYDDMLKGKIVIVNLTYTECTGICPGTTQNLTYVQELLGDRVGRDIFMYSISLTPERDTPEKLAEYMKLYNVGPGWEFFTGERASIETVRTRLGFRDVDPAVDENIESHTGTLRIGNEPLHRWVMAAGFANPNMILRSVRNVVPDWS